MNKTLLLVLLISLPIVSALDLSSIVDEVPVDVFANFTDVEIQNAFIGITGNSFNGYYYTDGIYTLTYYIPMAYYSGGDFVTVTYEPSYPYVYQSDLAFCLSFGLSPAQCGGYLIGDLQGFLSVPIVVNSSYTIFPVSYQLLVDMADNYDSVIALRDNLRDIGSNEYYSYLEDMLGG